MLKYCRNRIVQCQIVAAVGVLLAARLCFAWADTMQDLRTAAGRMTSVSAKFVQEKHLQILVRPLISEGRLYFQTPDALRWEYLRPIQSILITRAGETKKFIRKDGRIIADAAAGTPALQFVAREISRWFTGRFDENPVFSADLEPGRRIVLSPTGKGVASMVQRIELRLSDRPGVMESVMIYEAEDSYTRITFSDVELNRPLDPELFEEMP